ncbi:ATP-grasp domain-containing protein [Actinomadura rupiterrae]|uniref:ATP-grasp domain-containing protein n=1 Tax=Actinomadura rupiterrae TaxID=559627 RepID=UPI0020A5862D|nr:ATP-grasp domain-containing protein [Actinomadura rupiterrae]MCP2336341.1 biotin carboxylase [Actinomadura rupiterrae]
MRAVVVIGSGEQAYREYLLAGAAREARLWLVDGATPTWQSPYLAGAATADMSDPDSVLAAVRAIGEADDVGGVFCYDESVAPAAAYVVQELGLPGMDVATVWACRDKHRTRRILAAAGIPQPPSIAVRSLDEARDATALTGFPAVLKPRALGASMGVVMARTPAELPSAYAEARAARHDRVPGFDDGVLVEGYLDGPEISIDGILTTAARTEAARTEAARTEAARTEAARTEGTRTEGARTEGGDSGAEYRPLFLARKELGAPPHFEETGHTVDPRDPLLRDRAVLGLLRAAHRALGVRDAITHTEIRLTAAGPRLIEVNPRLGGDLIPYLGMLASGIDPGRAAARTALGLPVPLDPDPRAVVGIRFLYPDDDCEVESVTLPSPDDHPDLLEAAATVHPGASLRRHPPDRYGHVICKGPDTASCRSALRQAAQAARLTARSCEPA